MLEEMEEEIENIKKTSQDLMVKDGEHFPMIFAYWESGRRVLAPVVTGASLSTGEAIAMALRDMRPDAYIVVVDSWIAIVEGKDGEFTLDQRPSEMPNRKEAIVISLTHPAKKQVWTAIYNRNEENKVIGFEEWKKSDSAEGRVVDALDPPKTRH